MSKTFITCVRRLPRLMLSAGMLAGAFAGGLLATGTAAAQD